LAWLALGFRLWAGHAERNFELERECSGWLRHTFFWTFLLRCMVSSKL